MLSPVRVPYEVNYYIEVCTEPNMQNKNNNSNLQNHCTKENAQTNWRERQFANIVHKSKQSKHLKVQLGPTVNYEKKVYVCHVFAYSCPAPSPWSVGWDPPWMTRKCMSVTFLPAPPSSPGQLGVQKPNSKSDLSNRIMFVINTTIQVVFEPSTNEKC